MVSEILSSRNRRSGRVVDLRCRKYDIDKPLVTIPNSIIVVVVMKILLKFGGISGGEVELVDITIEN